MLDVLKEYLSLGKKNIGIFYVTSTLEMDFAF